MPVGCRKIPKVQIEPGAPLDHQRDVLVVGERAVLDRADALLHGEAEARAPVRVRGGVGARAIGLLDGGADLVARVGAGRGHAPRRADAARDEDLDMVGAAPQVLARAAADLVHAVVAGERPPVAIVRGEASSRHQEARPGDDPRRDGLPQLEVEEVLLAHDPHGGGARGEVAPQIRRGGERLGDGAAAELAELVAEARHDGGVAVAVDEPGHHEAVAPVDRLRAGRRRRGRRGPDGRDAPVGHDDRGIAQRRRARRIEQRPQRITRVGATCASPPARASRAAHGRSAVGSCRCRSRVSRRCSSPGTGGSRGAGRPQIDARSIGASHPPRNRAASDHVRVARCPQRRCQSTWAMDLDPLEAS